MTVGPTDDLQHQNSDASAALARYGITHASQDLFFYGGYRYTNLQDAIAEALRHPLETSTAAAIP